MTTVTLKPASRRERKKSAIRARIIAEGVRLFSRHGIADVTVDQIAAAADVGKGTIYNYFRTKEDVLVAFMADHEARIEKKMLRLLKRDLDAPAMLIAYLRESFRLKRPYHQFTRVFISQLVLRGEELLPYISAMQPAADATLHALFNALRARHRIRDDRETDVLVLHFKTLHLGLAALAAMLPADSDGVEQLAEDMVRHFCRGLEKSK